MRSLSDNSTSAISAPITSPGYLVSIDFDDPLYLSTRGDILWNSQTWHSYNIRLSGLNVSSTSAAMTGTMTIADPDFSFTTLTLESGIADRAINIYTFYGDAPGDDDPVLIFEGVGDSASFSPSTAQISITLILSSSQKMMCPRRYISKALGFNFLPPTGSIITWNNEQFVLQGSDT